MRLSFHRPVSSLLFVLVVFLWVSQAKASPEFELRASLAQGTEASNIAVADFDGDGIPDIAEISNIGNQLQIFRGLGNGSFSPPKEYPIGFGSQALAVADLNHDGRPDVVVLGGDNPIGVFMNRGDGTFNPVVGYSAPDVPSRVTIADFNKDGNVDIATADGVCFCISVLLGNGGGSFQPTSIETPLSVSPLALAAGVFGSNHTQDIAVTEEYGSTSQLVILAGNGDGTFHQASVYDIRPSARSLVVADFNRDGKADLAIAEGDDVVVMLGKGDETFKGGVEYAVSFPQSLALADINNDGNLDLVVANNQPFGVQGEVSLLFGRGDGTFDAPTSFPVQRFSWSAVAADFNGDHLLDIAVGDNFGVTVFANTGRVSFSPNTPLHVAPSPPQTVTLTNHGKTALKISSISASVHFKVTNNCGTSVAAGASCAMNVTFDAKTNPIQGAISVIDNASSKPQVIPVSGTEIALSPDPAMFGSQRVGGSSPPMPVTVTNMSNQGVIFFGIIVSGLNPKSFSLTDTANCTSAVLNPGASCTFSATFSPTKIGSQKAIIKVSDNGGGSPELLTMSGTGT